MKKYSKLPIPKDSAWDKKTWRYYLPIWFNQFVDSMSNLIDWLPIIWHDRHWDDYYITKIIQRKIELQRAYLVKHNRHTEIDYDNFWMTTVLNLIEREHESFYELEKYDYCEINHIFSEPDKNGVRTINSESIKDNLDEYLSKYPSTVRKVKQLKPNLDKKGLALFVGIYNQRKCRSLIFEILKQKSARWWD
jgi:hypothetical protein